MIEVDNIVVNREVLDTKFTCDLKKCKGACCTMESEYGAPITSEEISKMIEVYPVVKEYLSEKNIKEIEKKGFWEEKSGQLMTTSIDNKDCVFVYYEGKIAKCAIEKAYFDGKIDFRKPISCHLFPIRVTDFGGPILMFEHYKECDEALKLGKKTDIKVIDFCKDSLERLYGETWYQKVKEKLGEK